MMGTSHSSQLFDRFDGMIVLFVFTYLNVCLVCPCCVYVCGGQLSLSLLAPLFILTQSLLFDSSRWTHKHLHPPLSFYVSVFSP